jgi:biopolymer transport protein ExbD
MAITVGQGAEDAEQEVMAAINTTPLVDVMLVLLIIFLITIPVVVQQVPVELPKERNVPTQTKPENIVIAINKDGDVFWNMEYVRDSKALFEKLKTIATLQPQPEVHIRADQETRYESVGRVVATLQRAAILKIGFITEPPARSAL